MTTSVLLVRHAQSTGNAERMWQGLIDAPLSELGEAQARAAAAAVGGVDAIVASSMERAWRTAEIIAETLGVGPVIRIPELRERDLGAWTGLTTREITTRWPDVVIGEWEPDDAEPREAVRARTRAALLAIATEFDGADVFAVAHGGIVRTLERDLGHDDGPAPNLSGRRFEVAVAGDTLHIRAVGERVQLIDPDFALPTSPTTL